ncbi:MAG: ATP-binding SpoIIE family protein phosphatase [Halanaerobiales bacterium]
MKFILQIINRFFYGNKDLYIFIFVFLGWILFFISIYRKNKEIDNLKEKLSEQKVDLKRFKKFRDKNLNKARQIHQNSLPDKLPQPEGLQMAAYYNPAEQLGGDYYNVVKIDHGSMDVFFDQYFIYMFDVSGHGLDSAMLSLFINETIENYFKLRHQEGELLSPAKILKYIDKQYRNEGYPDDYMVCIFGGVLDVRENNFVFSSLGFQFPFYHVKNDKIKELKTGGLPVSSSFDPELIEFQEKEIKLQENSFLFFTTDGLYEQKVADEIYGDILKSRLRKTAGLPAPFVSNYIIQDFKDFTKGRGFKDDITFLTISSQGDKEKTWQGNSSKEGFKDLKHKIIKYIKENICLEKEDIIFAFKELLANACEHGNKLDPDKKVTVKILLKKEKYLMILIEDEGNGFDWREELQKEFELNREERGRGLALVRRSVDLITYNEKGNQAFILNFLN